MLRPPFEIKDPPVAITMAGFLLLEILKQVIIPTVMQDDDLEILQPTENLRPFPEVDQVFVADQAKQLREHLHPLISINLTSVNPSWDGWAHILSPIEPHDGLIGDGTTEYHSQYMRTNMLMFSMEGNLYRQLGDMRFFLLEQDRASLNFDQQSEFDARSTYYEEAEKSYSLSKASYQKHGYLYWLNEQGEITPPNRAPSSLLDQLGGNAFYGNWCVGADFPIDPPDDSGDEYPTSAWPIAPSGRRFEFVASVSGYPYRDHGADAILLFYQPEDQLALLTFDWT